eukprot:5870776-Alexandrium_andersonii.AAC.1
MPPPWAGPTGGGGRICRMLRQRVPPQTGPPQACRHPRDRAGEPLPPPTQPPTAPGPRANGPPRE